MTILIHTFNEYSRFWNGCLEGWDKYGYNPIIGTDIKEHGEYNAKFLYSGLGEWSNRLKVLLSQIPDEYIIYAQEDHWPVRIPPDFDKMIYLVQKYDLYRLQLSPIIQYYSLVGTNPPFYFHEKSKYLVSHQPSIWKKSFLLECLAENETPWKNEYEGTKRLNVRSDIQKKIAIYPHDWYSHVCVGGKSVKTVN